MKVYITTCCKEKSTQKGEIPAMERYLSDRIDTIYAKSKADEVEFYILSGKYGLLSPSAIIPCYDKILNESDTPEMIAQVKHQMKDIGTTEVVFFAKPEWETYIAVMEQACEQNGVAFHLELWIKND